MKKLYHFAFILLLSGSVLIPYTNAKVTNFKHVKRVSQTTNRKVSSTATTTPVVSDQHLSVLRTNVKATYKKIIDDLDKDQKMKSVSAEITKLTIAKVQKSISESEGFKIGNPLTVDIVDSTVRIFNTQIAFENKNLSAQNSVIEWEKQTEAYLVNSYSLIDVASNDQLIAQIARLNKILSDRNSANLTLEKWSNQSDALNSQIEGYLAGLESSNQPLPINITPVYPTFNVTLIAPPVPAAKPVQCDSTRLEYGSFKTICY